MSFGFEILRRASHSQRPNSNKKQSLPSLFFSIFPRSFSQLHSQTQLSVTSLSLSLCILMLQNLVCNCAWLMIEQLTIGLHLVLRSTLTASFCATTLPLEAPLKLSESYTITTLVRFFFFCGCPLILFKALLCGLNWFRQFM